ncbi:acyl carrier protein [Sphingobium cloacae]|uniref:acyl carrier protein n=1 Tax=Sphingobium cloacae TaxID=120107 RepID=UPI00082C8E51|nr:acyl carrier protein [Sphingobium cloacae]
MARGGDIGMADVAALFADVFGIPAETVESATSADDVGTWDSMGHLVLIQTIEERFRITLEMNEMFEIVDAGSALTVLQRHGASGHA